MSEKQEKKEDAKGGARFVLKKQSLKNLTHADLTSVGGGMMACSNDPPRTPLTPGTPPMYG